MGGDRWWQSWQWEILKGDRPETGNASITWIIKGQVPGENQTPMAIGAVLRVYCNECNENFTINRAIGQRSSLLARFPPSIDITKQPIFRMLRAIDRNLDVVALLGFGRVVRRESPRPVRQWTLRVAIRHRVHFLVGNRLKNHWKSRSDCLGFSKIKSYRHW